MPADDLTPNHRPCAGGALEGERAARVRRSPFLPDDLPAALMNGAKPKANAKARTVSMGASEHVIQCAVAQFLDLALDGIGDCVWWAVPNGGFRDVRTAAKLKAEGVKPGVSDIMVMWRGRLLCIELKTDKGRQSAEQKEWAEAITCAGGVYYLARSVEQVEEFLDAVGIPLRARTKSAVGRASAK